jgi:ankyrin repeat protein
VLLALLVAGSAAAQAPAPKVTGTERLKAMSIAFEPERLVQFAGQGDAAVVEAFLEAGMSPDAAEPKRGSTALIHAAANGHAGIVTRLLGAGAAVDRPDSEGTTALTAACNFARGPVVQLLLAKGASPSAAGRDATSALEAAIWGGDAGIVKRLLAAGADAIGQDRETPPLVRAAYTGRVEILAALLEAKPPGPLVRRALEAARKARHAEAEALLSKALP